jgi:hypothetical protein
MEIVLQQLVNLLKILKLRPASGFGFTNIEWKNGEIYLITKVESYKPEDIN